MDSRLTIGLLLVVLVSCAKEPEKSKFKSKIIGGRPALAFEAPWQVSIGRERGGHFCGGSIISIRAVLTAAHCVEGVRTSSLILRIGSLFHSTGGQEYRVSRAIRHPQYNKEAINNDLAVLQTTNILPSHMIIPLAANIPLRGAMASIFGWGATRNSLLSESGPLQLLSASVPIVRHADCQRSYPTKTITPQMICAGYPRSLMGTNPDACQGDSGGPLVVSGQQVGVVSFGQGCGMKYGVYASVPANLNWIMAYM